MSAIPVIGKIFEEIDKNPILKTVAIAAAIYFTASAATSYFSSAGASTAAAGGGMAATTSVAATEAVSAGVIGAEAVTAGTVGSVVGGVVGEAGTVAAEQIAAKALAEKATTKVAASWFAKNPVATMILGQGISGAASSVATAEAQDKANKLQQQQLDQNENARTERGLMGYNYNGSYAGQQNTGMISSQMQQPDQSTTQPDMPAQNTPTVAAQQTSAPIIASQQVTQQEQPIPNKTPVKLADLPKLNQSRV